MYRITCEVVRIHKANGNVTTIFRADTRNQQIVTGREIFDVKTGRLVGKLASACAFAGKSEVANIFDALINERHFFSSLGGQFLSKRQ